MKLGFFVTNQYLPGESMPQKIQDSVEQVAAARDAGFSLIATGQHYLAAPYQMSTIFPLLSRLAADPDLRAQFGAAGFARAREHYDESRIIARQIELLGL